jgi:hypothetical protein
MLFANKI